MALAIFLSPRNIRNNICIFLFTQKWIKNFFQLRIISTYIVIQMERQNLKVFIRIYIQKFFNESLVKLQAWVTKMPPMSISHRMNWQHLKNDPKMAYHLCPITKFCGHVSANNNQSWANPKLNTLVLKVPNFYTC